MTFKIDITKVTLLFQTLLVPKIEILVKYFLDKAVICQKIKNFLPGALFKLLMLFRFMSAGRSVI